MAGDDEDDDDVEQMMAELFFLTTHTHTYRHIQFGKCSIMLAMHGSSCYDKL